MAPLVIGSAHVEGKEYVLYRNAPFVECCHLDLRSPVLEFIQNWIKAQDLPLKAIAHQFGLSLWAVKAIVRGGYHCQIPTQTLFEIKADIKERRDD